MSIVTDSLVEHRSVTGFDIGPKWSGSGVQVMAPGACSSTSCCSCSASTTVAVSD